MRLLDQSKKDTLHHAGGSDAHADVTFESIPVAPLELPVLETY